MVFMKKGIIAFIFFINVLFAVFSQNSGSIDLILILDTSQEMISSYEKVNDYITNDFLREFLRIGDTFHLICFSSGQRVDVARRIQGRGDIETIIGRMLLQYPLDKGNDYRGALNFAQDYVSSLPQRAKKIVIVSAGGSQLDNAVNDVKQNFTSRNITVDVVHVNQGQVSSSLPRSNRTAAGAALTPSSSENRITGVTQAVTQPAVRNDVSTLTDKTTTPSSNTTDIPASGINGVSSPGTAAVSSTNTNGVSSDSVLSSNTTGRSAAASGTEGVLNSDSGKIGGSSDNELNAKDDTSFDTALISDLQNPEKDKQALDTDSDQRKAAPLPPIEKDKQALVTDSDVYHETGAEKTSRIKGFAISVPLLAGLAVIALIVLILIIIFVIKKLRSSPNRVIAKAALYSKKKNEEDVKFKDHSKELAKYAAAQSSRRTTPYQDKPVRKIDETETEISSDGPLLLNLFVEDQNTLIGKRNIHSLKSGYSLSVGGGNSDFLIFLVTVPANIGELRRDGSKLTFIPRKPNYFPDIGSSEVNNCLNKTIRIISSRNYEVRFRFEMWEDPLIALNRLMNSFRIPG
jgi:hypothetical protein